MATAREPNFISRLDQTINEYNLLRHPFYRAWTEGRLSRESLKLYAAQYYRHVEAFPEYLHLLAERADGELRTTIEENLQEEVNPSNPHPRLWRDFAAAVGVDELSLGSDLPLSGIRALVDTYREICAHDSPAEAVAALYAYESQVPEIAKQKAEGLRRHYGITEPSALAYFEVHQEADVRHRAAWRDWLARQRSVEAGKLLRTAERGLKALWAALDAVCLNGSST